MIKEKYAVMIISKVSQKYKLLSPPVKSAFWFTICSFLQHGVAVITTPIWTRLFSAEDFGKYSIFISWKSILAVFITFNLTAGVFTRGLLKYEEHQDDFVSSMEGLLSCITFFYLALYFLFRTFWNDFFELDTTLMLCMIAMLWVETVFGFWAAREQFNYRYKKLITITLTMSLVNPITGIISVLMVPNNKVEARIITMTILQVVTYTVFFIIQFFRSKHFFNISVWKFAFFFNLPLIPHYLSQTILNSSDRIMIGKMVGEREAGLYSLAYSVAMILTLLNASIQQAFNPWLYRKIKAAEYDGIGKASYTILSIVAFVNILFITFAPETVRIFAPAEYLEAVWTMPPVTMSVFFMFMYCLFADFEFYYEKTIFIALASVLGAILNILLNWFCIPHFGYIAAGYTTLICYALYVTAHYYAMRIICLRKIGTQKIYKPQIIVSISVIFMALGFAAMFLYCHPTIKYLLFVIVITVVFLFRKQLSIWLSQVISVNNGKIELR